MIWIKGTALALFFYRIALWFWCKKFFFCREESDWIIKGNILKKCPLPQKIKCILFGIKLKTYLIYEDNGVFGSASLFVVGGGSRSPTPKCDTSLDSVPWAEHFDNILDHFRPEPDHFRPEPDHFWPTPDRSGRRECDNSSTAQFFHAQFFHTQFFHAQFFHAQFFHSIIRYTTMKSAKILFNFKF